MAALSASCVVVGCGPVLGMPSSSSSVATRAASPVARFNGLRACPVLRQSAVIWRRPAAPRRSLTVSAVADEPTLQTVQKLIAKQLAVNTTKVLPESTFVDLGADSLDTVEIIMAIEEEFKVSLEEGGAEKITTVQEAADLIFAVKNQSANA